MPRHRPFLSEGIFQLPHYFNSSKITESNNKSVNKIIGFANFFLILWCKCILLAWFFLSQQKLISSFDCRKIDMSQLSRNKVANIEVLPFKLSITEITMQLNGVLFPLLISRFALDLYTDSQLQLLSLFLFCYNHRCRWLSKSTIAQQYTKLEHEQSRNTCHSSFSVHCSSLSLFILSNGMKFAFSFFEQQQHKIRLEGRIKRKKHTEWWNEM